MERIRAIIKSNYPAPTDSLWLRGNELKAYVNGAWTTIGGGKTPTITWNSVQGKPTFATVATSGSYNDLSNKPLIPQAAVNATTTRAGIVKQIDAISSLLPEATLTDVINSINSLYQRMTSAGIMQNLSVG